MRANPTEAERLLWDRLRRKQLNGFRFRRQHPIDYYIVDFYCPSARLIVEVDGEDHKSRLEYDLERQAVLEGHGYRTIRFTNTQVLNRIDLVLAAIRLELKKNSPYPNPFPLRGRVPAIAGGKGLVSL